MWKFWKESVTAALPEKVKSCLNRERGLSELAASRLRMLEKVGHFYGRTVTFFRVFDQKNARTARLDLRQYDDVGPDWTLYSGHIEDEGQIVLDRKPTESPR